MDAAFIWKLSKLGRIGSSRMRFDDDVADRLNYQYTGVILFMFIGLIGIRQYVGKPIQCWIPQEFTRGWEEYAENYCWVANTYFAKLKDRLPPEADRSEAMIAYYQWAPIVLATQALLFYLPCLIWRLCMNHSGFNVHRVLQMAADANELMPEVTAKTVNMMSRYLEACIHRQRNYRRKHGGIGFRDHRHRSRERRGSSRKITEIDPEEGVSGTESFSGRSSLLLPASKSEKVPLRHDSESNGTLTARAKKASAPSPPAKTSKSARDGKQSSSSVYSSPQGKTQSRSSERGKMSESRPHTARASSKPPTCKALCMKLLCCPEDNEKAALASKSMPNGDLQRERRREWGIGKKYGNFLFTLYMFVKLAYIANVIGQVFLMEAFIGTPFTFFGARILWKLLNKTDWEESGHFPRVTFCSLKAKKLGADNDYELQCVLPLNMFLEKIYIFLWFWHVAVALVTVVSLVSWIRRMLLKDIRFKFIRKYLKVLNAVPEPLDAMHKAATRTFVEHYLCTDGVFLLRLISTNCGEMLAGDLACELWRSFRHQHFHIPMLAAAAGIDLTGQVKFNPPMGTCPHCIQEQNLLASRLRGAGSIARYHQPEYASPNQPGATNEQAAAQQKIMYQLLQQEKSRGSAKRAIDKENSDDIV
ncbi:hypothetical protein Ciccas_002274 [Cichlidogyrus casuarinus]|uniref:Innexin n=1 Tax=Cichlidogyrus casuarinus TaxID=1844966 RepID=A0ABD2QHP0_9PLAT